VTRNRIILFAALGVLVAAALGTAVFLFSRNGEPAANGGAGMVTTGATPPATGISGPVRVEGIAERSLGNPDAPVTIIEYSSLTCPHCAAFHRETLPQLKAAYIDTGKARLIYRDFPFDQAGVAAAVLARCAPEERYFSFLDVLFSRQEQWLSANDPMAALQQIGAQGGVSPAAFQNCLQNEDIINAVLSNRLGGAEEYQVQATPTFIIGADKIVGSQPFDAFAEVIDRQLGN